MNTPSGRMKRLPIVPLAGDTRFATVRSVDAGVTTASLQYGGGALLGSVEVTAIYWGDFWAPPVPPSPPSTGNTLARGLDAFFDFILTSQFMDTLQEYSSGDTLITYGKRVASAFIAGQPGTSTTGGMREVSDDDIQSALKGWIAAGTVPAAGKNSLYFVYLPQNATCTGVDDAKSCIDMCGYHWQIDNNIFYAVVPFVTCGGCNSGGAGMLDVLTKISSHELAEAITDPDPFSGWNDSDLGEIGDICNTDTLRLGGFWIQSLWSNTQSACSTHLVPSISQLATAVNEDGRIELFALTAFDSVDHAWQTLPNGGWGLWASLGGVKLRAIAAGKNADGRLELFAVGGDRAIYHTWQVQRNGGWTGWTSLGGTDLQQVVVGSNEDGRIEVFALGGDRSVYHAWQAVPNGDWRPWAPLGGHDIQSITVGRNADGRLELFAIGGDHSVYHIWQVVPNGDWGPWASLGGQDIQQIVVANNQDGRIELFALGGDRSVYHRWQLVPNGDWGNWSPLAGVDIRQMSVANNADGRLELFVLGGDRSVYHIWQLVPNGDWGNWKPLGGTGLLQVTADSNADGRIELFAVGGDSFAYHIWQAVPNGDWTSWTMV